MKTHATELPRIAENQRALRLPQEKMIMLSGHEIGSLRTQAAAHPEMNA